MIESDTLDVGRCEYVRITDTVEVGRYEMENGEYVKKVSRAGDYDFAKTN